MLEEGGIANARAHASARGLSDRANFSLADCAGVLPFEDSSFDAVLCIDAIPHLPNRFGTLREWTRLLRHRGRVVFTDNAVITGEIAKSELDLRTASGFYLFVPPGFNEKAIKPPVSLYCDVTTVRLQRQRLELVCALRGFVTLSHSSRRKAPMDFRNGRGCMRSQPN